MTSSAHHQRELITWKNNSDLGHEDFFSCWVHNFMRLHTSVDKMSGSWNDVVKLKDHVVNKSRGQLVTWSAGHVVSKSRDSYLIAIICPIKANILSRRKWNYEMWVTKDSSGSVKFLRFKFDYIDFVINLWNSTKVSRTNCGLSLLELIKLINLFLISKKLSSFSLR